MRARGQGKGWDCDEWAEHTDFSKLPRKVRQKKGAVEPPSFIGEIAAAAALVTIGGRG